MSIKIRTSQSKSFFFQEGIQLNPSHLIELICFEKRHASVGVPVVEHLQSRRGVKAAVSRQTVDGLHRLEGGGRPRQASAYGREAKRGLPVLHFSGPFLSFSQLLLLYTFHATRVLLTLKTHTAETPTQFCYQRFPRDKRKLTKDERKHVQGLLVLFHPGLKMPLYSSFPQGGRTSAYWPYGEGMGWVTNLE